MLKDEFSLHNGVLLKLFNHCAIKKNLLGSSNWIDRGLQYDVKKTIIPPARGTQEFQLELLIRQIIMPINL